MLESEGGYREFSLSLIHFKNSVVHPPLKISLGHFHPSCPRWTDNAGFELLPLQAEFDWKMILSVT